MNYKSLLIPCVAVLLISACVTPPPAKETISTVPDNLPIYNTVLEKQNKLIVSNLVSVLAQLKELRSAQTTIQITEPFSNFGKTVLASLQDAGFGIQKVEGDLGPKYVRYRIEDSITERGPLKRFTLSIGQIEASRDYKVVGINVLPDSNVEVSGAPEESVELNDEIFVGTGTNYENNINFTDSASSENSLDNSDIFDGSNSPQATQLIKRNIYESRESNYSTLFSNYRDVESTILVFPNDSLELDQQNKNIIAGYIRRMDPATDIISVIGCSHGASDITNGNSTLALGRADRVKEEFLLAGIESGKILDEGCWADQHFDDVMPRRGVVLARKRSKG